MQNTDYFVWDADPTMLDLGIFNLPFSVPLYGLIAGFILFFYGLNKLAPAAEPGKEKEEPEVWKVFALFVGSLVAGIVVFLVIPSPMIQEIGPVQIRWYGPLFASSFIVGYILEYRMFLRGGYTQEQIDKLLIYMVIGTVVGARLGHIIFYDPGFYIRHPYEIIAIWHGGLASHGAAIGIILAMYLFARKIHGMNFLWLADRVVIVVAIGGAFIRTGNFMNSEIVGEPSTLPWAVVFARRTDLEMIPRHPTMLYEAVLCIIVFAVLWTMYKRYKNEPPEGSLFGLFLVMLFTGRILLEFTKLNQAAFAEGWLLNMGQVLSIPLVLIGLWLIFKKVRWKQGAPARA